MTVDRISFTSSQLGIQANIRRVQLQYQQASEPATTGLKINHLSDNSSVISRVFSIRNQVSSNEEYQKNISRVDFELSFADQQLSQVSDAIERAHDIALNASNPVIDTTTQNEIGSQFDTIKDEILGYTNARSNDRYIFAGTKTDTKPFTGTPGSFNGNSLDFVINISSNVQIDANLDGRKIFLGNVATATSADLATQLKSSNGVPLGLAVGDVINIGGSVDSAVSGTMTVTSATTLNDIASFMQASLRASGDGTEVAAVRPDGSIRVTSGAGDPITNLNLSVTDRPEFNTAFTFPANIASGGATGSSDALKAGTGEDIFDVLDDLKTAISNGDGPGIQTHLARLESLRGQINEGRTQVGTRMQQVISGKNFLEDEGVRLLTHLSDLQDADVSEAFTTLISRESALKLVLQSSSRFLSIINDINLFS